MGTSDGPFCSHLGKTACLQHHGLLAQPTLKYSAAPSSARLVLFTAGNRPAYRMVVDPLLPGLTLLFDRSWIGGRLPMRAILVGDRLCMNWFLFVFLCHNDIDRTR